jgi:hypothetical protein
MISKRYVAPIAVATIAVAEAERAVAAIKSGNYKALGL